MNISKLVEEDSTSSVWHYNLSHIILLRCLHTEKLHPCQLAFVQELTEDEPNIKTNVCKRMMNKVNRNEKKLGTILLSEELIFALNGKVN